MATVQPDECREWLSMSTYAEPQRLLLSMRALAGAAIGTDHVHVIGVEPAVQRMAGAIAAGTGRRLIEPAAALPIGAIGPGTPLLATPGPLSRQELASQLRPEGVLRGLDVTLASGAVALLVRTYHAPDFATATRALLSHSADHVRTREMTRLPPDDQAGIGSPRSAVEFAWPKPVRA